MDLDPEIAAAFAANRAQQDVIRGIEATFDVEVMRSQRDQLTALWNADLDRTGVATSTLDIVGRDGFVIELRMHRPIGATRALPCYFHVHGGGQVAGSAPYDDKILVPIVQELGCLATSVEYRLPPEHPAPTPAEDVVDAFEWLASNAASVGVDDRSIALGGTSGGGGIAAAASLMLRDRAIATPCLVVLVCPMLDDRGTTRSAAGDWLVWPATMNQRAWKAVLGSAYGTDRVTSYQAPARATDLTGLPPTFIDVGAQEVFRDECIDYSVRLAAAGVDTELHVYPGCPHGFDLLAPQARVSRTAVSVRYAALTRVFHPDKPE